MRRLAHALICGSLLILTSCGSDDHQVRQSLPAPTGITAAPSSATSVHVMWNLTSEDPQVTGYAIYSGTTKVKEVPATERMVDVMSLEPATTYHLTVRALSDAGEPGPPSELVSVTTLAAVAADSTAPTAPRQPNGKALGSKSVQLSWQKSTDDRGVASYEIYQGDSKIHSISGGQTTTVVTNLRPGISYSFTVKARDAADNVSPPSAAVRLVTAADSGDGRSTAPTDFRAGAHFADGAYYLDLSWIPPATDGVISQYEILLNGQLATSLVWGSTPPPGKATYSFYVGPDARVTYRAKIRAKLPDGTWGGYSAESTVTTGARK